jgi:hypothetical protein
MSKEGIIGPSSKERLQFLSQLEQLKLARGVLFNLGIFFSTFPQSGFLEHQGKASLLIRASPPKFSDENARRLHAAKLEGAGWITENGESVLDFGRVGLRLLGDPKILRPVIFKVEYKPPYRSPQAIASCGDPSQDAWRVKVVLKSLMRSRLKKAGVALEKKRGDNMVRLYNKDCSFSVDLREVGIGRLAQLQADNSTQTFQVSGLAFEVEPGFSYIRGVVGFLTPSEVGNSMQDGLGV